MAEGNNVLMGILAIILGILVIAFPLFSVFTVSILAGLAVIFVGIWLLAQSFGTWSASKGASIAYLLLGIIGIIVGIGLFGNILAFSAFASFLLYFAGIFMIIAGIMSLFAKEGTYSKGSGAMGIILGILYLIVGIYALNPLYLAGLIGIFLILSGIFQIFLPTPEE